MEGMGAPDRFETELRRELQRGERLLWHARAIKRAKRGSKGILFFATIWTGFSLFWTGAAFVMTRLGESDPGMIGWAFPAFGLPFILIGLAMFARPVLTRIAAGRTAYGLTDRRVIQLYLGKGVMSESIPLDDVKSIKRHERRDGSGTLELKMRNDPSTKASERITGFDLGEVPEVREVERKLRDARDRAKAASS